MSVIRCAGALLVTPYNVRMSSGPSPLIHRAAGDGDFEVGEDAGAVAVDGTRSGCQPSNRLDGTGDSTAGQGGKQGEWLTSVGCDWAAQKSGS